MSVSIRQQLTAFNRLIKAADDIYYNYSVEMGLSDSAQMILYGLCQSDHPCTQKDLCDAWSLKKQTVHAAVNNLSKSGYVRLKPLPNNSRIKQIVLTEEGKALAQKTAIPLLKAEEVAFSHFTAEERELLLTLTEKHVELLREETEHLLQSYNRKNSCTFSGETNYEKTESKQTD